MCLSVVVKDRIPAMMKGGEPELLARWNSCGTRLHDALRKRRNCVSKRSHDGFGFHNAHRHRREWTMSAMLMDDKLRVVFRRCHVGSLSSRGAVVVVSWSFASVVILLLSFLVASAEVQDRDSRIEC